MSRANCCRRQGRSWMQDLAGSMLACATSPVLEVTCGRALLMAVTPALDVRDLHGASPPWSECRGFVLRATLVATAEVLLDGPGLGPDVATATEDRDWRRSIRALGFADALSNIPDPARDDAAPPGLEQGETNSLRMAHALSPMAAEAPDRLASEMRLWRDEPLDSLVGAHYLLRLAAGAWHLAEHGETALGGVAELLDQSEDEVAGLLRQTTLWDPLLAIVRPESESRRLIGRFRSLATLLLPLADADSPAAVLAGLERLLPQWLGQGILPLWADDDGGLTVHGVSNLAGLRVIGPRSLAASAVAHGSIEMRRTSARDAMALDAKDAIAPFDRQCAEWLSASSLVALPVLAPGPIAVLLTNAEAATDSATDAAAEDLNLLGIHAARWLKRFAVFERQRQVAVAAQSAGFRRRLQEAVHEISNPLSVIQNYLHLLGTRIDDNAPAQEQVRLITGELGRATELLHALTDEQDRDAAPVPEVAQGGDVNALLADVLSLVEGSLPPGRPIDIRFAPGADVSVPAAADQRLHQVVLNLIKNALEAMPAGGVLDVSVDRGLNERGLSGAAIRVADTGDGIEPALLEQIFEAGVSAKGKDRGLGLAIASRLLTELGGEISCRSRVGRGTTFTVWLPAAGLVPGRDGDRS